VQVWANILRHVCAGDWAHPCAASEPGLASPLPHLHRD
jgi:hypothetical protein